MKMRDESYSKKKGYGSYTTHNTTVGTYVAGCYISPNGIVRVYAEPKGGKNKKGLIALTYSRNGRVYYRSIRGINSISDKALSTRANQFIKSLNL
jgi:hypothetical protein